MTNQVIRIKSTSSAERILPSQHELFEDILEEMTTVRIDTEAEELQQMKEELARDEQRYKKLAESLRIALQTLQRLEARIKAKEMGEQREERRKPILNEEEKIEFSEIYDMRFPTCLPVAPSVMEATTLTYCSSRCE